MKSRSSYKGSSKSRSPMIISESLLRMFAPLRFSTIVSRSVASIETVVKIDEAQAVGAVTKKGRPRRDANALQPASYQRRERSQRIGISLLDIPGVGPKYEALFRSKGLSTITSLMALHHGPHKGDKQRTFEFIQEVVGVRNKGHISLMLNYLNESLINPALSNDNSSQSFQSSHSVPKGSFGSQPKLTLSVEGNIGVGKSTFLNILRQEGLNEHLSVVPEPVDKWQSVGDGNVNLLLEFYQDPKRLAYTFQNYVFLTRMVQERESYSQSLTRLLERSVFSDRMVFVRAVHKSKCLSDTELAIYDSWFNPVLHTLPTLVPNGFIYLRAKPETCHRRMTHRGRSEENAVPLDYLSDLHCNHEDWLWSGGEIANASKQLYIPSTGQTLVNPSPSGLNPALHPPPPGSTQLQILDPRSSGFGFSIPEIPTELRNSLRILDQSKANMLPQLHHIPALVLDYDEDVDIDRDIDYRKHIAKQVDLYTRYVREFTQVRAGAAYRSLPDATRNEFNGYYLRDERGQVMYTSPQWHLLSHAASPTKSLSRV